MNAVAPPPTGIGPLVIAHRGASADLPEHTLASKALAFGLGADFLEQDVVATRDDQLVVLHDIHLERVTDVVEQFPDRARPDGRFYARDFTLQELSALTALERMVEDRSQTVYPNRFPHRQGAFAVAALRDELEMVASLNRTTGRRVGVYPEIKRPAWHRSEGVDLTALVLRELKANGYSRRSDPVYLQCFDPGETRRLREELGCELRLVQLIADNALVGVRRRLRRVAEPAGPQGGRRIRRRGRRVARPRLQPRQRQRRPAANRPGLIEDAHGEGLSVHAYTFRADELPPGFDAFENLLDWFVHSAGVDGLFTDFTGETVAWRARRYPGA